jgi:ferredoxin
MAWVKEEMCTGCGVCMDECPVGAISVGDGKARIDEGNCIRCGRCHDVCPEDAVRHDSERIPDEIRANLQWTRELLRHYDTDDGKRRLIERMKRYFAKQKKVAEQTIERLDGLTSQF